MIRINFALLSAKGPMTLKDEEFQEVKKALHLYEDFLQKEKVQLVVLLKLGGDKVGTPLPQAHFVCT